MKKCSELRSRFNGKYRQIMEEIYGYEKLNSSYVQQHHNATTSAPSTNNKDYNDGYVFLHTPDNVMNNEKQ